MLACDAASTHRVTKQDHAMFALFCALALSADPSVTVRVPQERQVIQRADGATTAVLVEVQAHADAGPLMASVAVPGAETAKPTELAKQPGGSPEATTFRGRVELPAGGWYRLAISLNGVAGPVEVARVERFGVGEVFVVAGQSNSANSGEERLLSTDDRVSAFDGAAWTLAADPMPGVQDGSDGGSPWPACGALLAKEWNVPIAFASCGFGGTSIGQWQKDAAPIAQKKEPLYAALVQRARALGKFRAILWHQGESDASMGTSTADYASRFRALRDALTKDLGSSPPWIVAHVSFVPDLDAARMQTIRAAQEQLWKEKVALQGPDTDDLLGAMRHSKDRIHFSKAGLEEHGRRWAARILQLFPRK